MFHELINERFTPDWNDSAKALAAYERHNENVRKGVPSERLVEWQASDGWSPVCELLGVPVPEEPFPYLNTREEWFRESGENDRDTLNKEGDE